MARRSIDIEGFVHSNPIPAATRIGPYVTSSIIAPFNPATRDVPEALEDQIDNLFTHVGRILDGSGGTWDDVAKMTFYVADPGESRKALNGPWLERFPDPASRPARYNMKVESIGPAQIKCDFVAYIED